MIWGCVQEACGTISKAFQKNRGALKIRIQVENPEGLERGLAWVELDGQRLNKASFPQRF